MSNRKKTGRKPEAPRKVTFNFGPMVLEEVMGPVSECSSLFKVPGAFPRSDARTPFLAESWLNVRLSCGLIGCRG